MEPYSEVSSVALSDEEVVAVASAVASVAVSVVASAAEASAAVRAVAVVPLGAGKLLLHLIS